MKNLTTLLTVGAIAVGTIVGTPVGTYANDMGKMQKEVQQTTEKKPEMTSEKKEKMKPEMTSEKKEEMKPGMASEKKEEMKPETGSETTEKKEAAMKAEALKEFKKYVRGLKFLSKAEKKRLIVSEMILNKLLDEADEISKKMDAAYEKMEEDNAFFDEYDKIVVAYPELWEKFDKAMTEEQEGMENLVDAIKASKGLTEEEKDKLIKNQEKLEELEKKIEEMETKVFDSLKDLRDAAEKIYDKIDKEHEKNAEIWEKISENTSKDDFVPYLKK